MPFRGTYSRVEAPPVNADDNVCTGKKRIVPLVSPHVFVFRVRHGRNKGRMIGLVAEGEF